MGSDRRPAAALVILGLVLGGTCWAMARQPRANQPEPATPGGEADFAALRQRMVETQIRARGVGDERVLAALQEVPRHLFVLPGEQSQAYEDHPLPIGSGQTISQPYVVALMTALAAVGPQARVLEIGTGSGYQAAVLSRLAGEVYSIEIVPDLAGRALGALARLGYDNVHVRIGDGYRGWPEAAPFDAIVLTAAPPSVPPPLIAQLAAGGRMVVPVGEHEQDLMLLVRQADGTVRQEKILPVRFVPMTGEAQHPVP
jgi:protein-L-isoaspartate(D-aspartate) O-methyltransferase